MTLHWRSALLGLAGTAFLSGLAPRPGRAEAPWPSQPIKLVVPYPPGALTDTLGRMVGERVQAAFGQPAIVDNSPAPAPSSAPPSSPSSRPTAIRSCSQPPPRSASRPRSTPGR